MLGLLPPNIYFVNFEEENIDVNVYLLIIQTFKNLIPKHIEFWNIKFIVHEANRKKCWSTCKLEGWSSNLIPRSLFRKQQLYCAW
jgi:hypothetical protein